MPIINGEVYCPVTLSDGTTVSVRRSDWSFGLDGIISSEDLEILERCAKEVKKSVALQEFIDECKENGSFGEIAKKITSP